MGKYLFRLLLIFTFLFLGPTLFSQEKKLEKAKAQYDRYEYVNAQETYLKVANKGYRSANLFKYLGDSYYFNSQFNEASKWYKELINSYPDDVDSEYYFRYAQTLKANDEYEEANTYLDKFAEVNADDQRAKMYKSDPNYLERIDFQSGRYEIKNIAENSPFTDFGAAFYGEDIVFSSSRDTLVFVKSVHQWNNEAFLEFFKAEYDSVNGELSEVSKFDKIINSKFHESTPVFTKDRQTIYFTRNNYLDNKLGKDKLGTNKLKIYRSFKNETGKWLAPESLPFNSDEYSVAHPALSVDGQILYFSSDMPGGRGLSDIYQVAINSDGTFGEPKNLGPRINTEGKETFPFVSDNNELYFSSNGQIGLGGLDVYVTHLEPKTKQEGEIINVGKPINSTKDDFTFIIDYKSKKGFFSSNREGGKGGDDIYSLIELEKLRNSCEITITGVVRDSETDEIISGAKVTIFDEKHNLIEVVTVGNDGVYTSSKKIECSSKYFVKIEKLDYSSTEMLITTPDETQTMDLSDLRELKLVREVKLVKVGVGDDLAKKLSLNTIYFDFNQSYVRSDAKVELAILIEVLNQYPDMKIDVRSHTDSHGDDSYNLELSQQRVNATIKHLVKEGIAEDRLTGKGYGETQPINDCGNDTNCKKSEYQLNRRSEFIIVK